MMKLSVTSVLIGGAAASSFDVKREVRDSLRAVILEATSSKAERIVDELRTGGKDASLGIQGGASVKSIAGTQGYLIRSEAGDSACSGPPIELATAMGHCYANTTAQDSYYFSCVADGTHVVQSMFYCASDITCASCIDANYDQTLNQTGCSAGGTWLWDYSAGATCTSSTEPFADYDNGVIAKEYESAAECAGADSGDVTFSSFIPMDVCFPFFGNVMLTSCGDSNITYSTHNDSACATVDKADNSIPKDMCLEETDDDDDEPYYSTDYCATGPDDGDDGFCFHVDSSIDYKGVQYSYEQLRAGQEPECTVPHTPASRGVVIATSCDKTVRVTDTHLMATTKGFQLAYSLKPGDVLFGDYDGRSLCTVKLVQKEEEVQQYFGLNCVHSEVLASGLRASTFGDFHTLPSWYMTYVGGLVGSETASTLGEYVAEWYFFKK